MRIAAVSFLALALGAATLLPACALQTEPNEPGHFVGTVEEIDHTRFLSNKPWNVHVVGDDEVPGSCGMVFGIIPPGENVSATQIETVDPEGGVRAADKGSLRPGDRVEVWAPGTWLRSCPGQATAERIRILR
jgi:hypothetical protein